MGRRGGRRERRHGRRVLARRHRGGEPRLGSSRLLSRRSRARGRLPCALRTHPFRRRDPHRQCAPRTPRRRPQGAGHPRGRRRRLLLPARAGRPCLVGRGARRPFPRGPVQSSCRGHLQSFERRAGARGHAFHHRWTRRRTARALARHPSPAGRPLRAHGTARARRLRPSSDGDRRAAAVGTRDACRPTARRLPAASPHPHAPVCARVPRRARRGRPGARAAGLFRRRSRRRRRRFGRDRGRFRAPARRGPPRAAGLARLSRRGGRHGGGLRGRG